ncbi:carbohydrate-binding family 9-like protein [Paenibacillus sp. SC116]|uniref:carbohydrate-binding family 9-like protein n=1 Tax=Paenibacillus sp. SC116 TaxID=2968986 RepID=UPI00215A0E31|nr:carbohydrate-binding family 9-like protein [Paenibacillus sp. SC116]MCR8845861.1 carbohydrate-binding family 9-like protein [Paenibacillus sp. SC116]
MIVLEYRSVPNEFGNMIEIAASTSTVPVYFCRHVHHVPTDNDWQEMQVVKLVDVATGEKPRLQTTVQVCWTDTALHMRFVCEDDYIHSPYNNRDDLLFHADVVEWFIDVDGKGLQYYEFNLSPNNVVFDALILNGPDKPREYLLEWNADGLRTSVTKLEPSEHERSAAQTQKPMHEQSHVYSYIIELPFTDLNTTPQDGSEWRINCYRIDEDTSKERSYWAWSPTGEINFHVPERFGRLLFIR